MYGSRPTTDRIARMRELVRDRVIAIDAERALNITESYTKNLLVPADHQETTGHVRRLLEDDVPRRGL